MDEKTLQPCKNCGAPAEERTAGQQVYAECTNLEGYISEDGVNVPSCGMRTPQFGASLDYGARKRVQDIWNRSTAQQEGTKSNPLLVPQDKYYPEIYYLEDKVKYLCFREYDSKGGHRPSGLVGTYFIKAG